MHRFYTRLDNLWIYGVGGIIAPFIGIKVIDLLLASIGLAYRRMDMIKEFKSAFLMLLLLTLLTGAVYPFLVTGIAQAVMSARANGSLITREQTGGSTLIGQPFSSPKYFWSRPSATSPYPYNAASSSGSNQGPTDPAFTDAAAARVKVLRDADPESQAPVPVDLVTASGSGLDPESARRPLSIRSIVWPKLAEWIRSGCAIWLRNKTEGRQLGFLGEPRVNILELNLPLDALK